VQRQLPQKLGGQAWLQDPTIWPEQLVTTTQFFWMHRLPDPQLQSEHQLQSSPIPVSHCELPQ